MAAAVKLLASATARKMRILSSVTGFMAAIINCELIAYIANLCIGNK
jgi:hypothetical protein